MALISGSQTVTTANLTDLLDGGTSTLHSHAGGGPTEAVETDLENQGTSNADRYVSPETLRHGPGVAKAWCRINMSNQTFKVEYGMASIADAGTGVSDITVDDAFGHIHHFVVLSSGSTHVTTDQAATTTTVVRVNNRNNSNVSEDGGDIYVGYWGQI